MADDDGDNKNMVKNLSVKQKFIWHEFWKNFVILLIPVLIMETFTWISIFFEENKNIDFRNERILNQVESKLESLQQETSSIAFHFSKNTQTSYKAKAILCRELMNTDLVDSLEEIQQYLQSLQNANMEIYSIYVYFENDYGQFFDSRSGVQQLTDFYDVAWLREYMNMDSLLMYQKRTLQKYSFEEPLNVVSVYRKLYSSSADEQADGVVVVNYRQNDINQYMGNIALYDKQVIAAVTKDGEEIANSAGTELLQQEAGNYVQKRETDLLVYRSIIPYTSIYQQLSSMFLIAIVSLLIVLVLSIWLAWNSAKKDVNQLNNVVMLINHEIKPSDIMEIKGTGNKNLYEYILYNVLKIFLEQDYMKVQYSQRKYQMEMLTLQALQQQINPHFMNNTLNSIYWEAISISGGSNTCSEMVDKLSDIMKYAMGNSSKEVTLQDEINYIQQYISIQEDRFKVKINMIWEVDKPAFEQKVPKMILQPLIENAITHGIRQKQFQGGIKCKVRQREGYLDFTVIDTGMGVAKEREVQIQRQLMEREKGIDDGHIGLINTNLRMVLRYGEDARIRFRSKLGRGTIITFRIPNDNI